MENRNEERRREERNVREKKMDLRGRGCEALVLVGREKG